MKLIVVIIQPHKLNAVKKELEAANINVMTVGSVLGQGRQKGFTEIYKGAKEAGGMLSKIRLDIAVNDELVDTATGAIINGARDGYAGDGKIFILNMNECVRISSGERMDAAVRKDSTDGYSNCPEILPECNGF